MKSIITWGFLMGILLMLGQIVVTLEEVKNDRVMRVTEVHHHYDISSYGTVVLPEDNMMVGDANFVLNY